MENERFLPTGGGRLLSVVIVRVLTVLFGKRY